MTWAIECHQVKKCVIGEEGSEEILSISSFEVKEGEQVAIMGPSGSGKTTFLHLLAGLTLPTSGEIRIFGEAIETMTEGERDRLREKKIGVVFQQFLLFPYLTATENLLIRHLQDSPFRRKEEEEKAIVWLKLMGLDHRANRQVKYLSRGEKQRVAIARALYQEPSLLLVDEPTSSLDARTGMEIVDFLLTLTAGKRITLLLVTHDPNIAHPFSRKEEMSSLNEAYRLMGKVGKG
ncbi:MAG: ABC transporter ATP-binding protein [Thermicanus sp.]|nr:ABC transporter ATP-binding protein [Thermicanus sp.]